MAVDQQAPKKRTEGLDTEVQWLKGIGPRLAMLLQKLGLHTVRDVLYHFPRRYDDRRDIPPLMLLRPGTHATAKGRLVDVSTRSTRGGKVMLNATLDDGTGLVHLIWFNQPWVARDLKKVTGEIVAYGLVKEGNRNLEIASPEWEAIEEDDDAEEFARITPVYALTEGVQQWVVRRAARSAVEYFSSELEDPVPERVLNETGLRPLKWAIRQMHQPESEEARVQARRRLVFDEFLCLQLALQMRRQEVQQEVGISFPISKISGSPGGGSLFHESLAKGDTLWDEVHRLLPFELTGAQRRVIEEIWSDMERPVPMNRLVQGDVGSGKTAVAACAMLAAVRCGYQAAIMAPTEILAEQHYINLHALFEPIGLSVALLVGKQTKQQRQKSLTAAANGEAQICVGTHALVQEGVQFHKLGLAVIDEQHRFGVMQRAALRAKGYGHPDVLVMTATPIPRTLTMTIYGDLDLSVIDEMPPGRKPIRTHWKPPHERPQVYAGVRKLVEEGRQAYFVCPMISESEKMQTQAAEDLYYRLTSKEYADLRLGLLHGQLKAAEKEDVMQRFRRGELDILVCTVVVEVGVDVPNASLMVIEDANRFGLSQLHQLRGRVGRGEHQSYCVLVADPGRGDAEQRLKIMVQTTDGFLIAEEDLRIRGPGDVAGTKQHGELDFRVADLVQDGKMLEIARQAAMRILERDPGLASQENSGLVERVRERRSQEALIAVS